MTIREKIKSLPKKCDIIIDYYCNTLSDDKTHRILVHDEEYSFYGTQSTIFDCVAGYDWILDDFEVDNKFCSCVYDYNFAIFTILSYDYYD